MLIHSVALGAGFSEIDSTINVNDLGVYGDGHTEQSDTLQGILDAYTNIYFPPGKYSVNKSLRLRSHHQISGSDSTVLVPTGEGATADEFSFFTIRSAQNIRMERLTFYAEDNPEHTVFAVSARNVHGLTLEHLVAYNAGIAEVRQQKGYPYSEVASDLSSKAFRQVGNTDINIQHCRGEGSRKATAQHTAGVLIAYTNHWKVIQSSFSRYDQGVQWWGGDSNPERDGKIDQVRKCQDGLVSDVMVAYVRGGGIWGSMGENITVENCHVTHCKDVGIDFEGCFESKAINNYVAESKNGNIAVFHHNQDILFANNQLVQSDPKKPQACIYNASQSQDNGQVVFDNNIFVTTQGVGHIKQRGPSNRIIFTQNSLHNVVANFSFNNNKYVNISHNIFLITHPVTSYDYVLQAGQTHYGGKVVIENNHIVATVPQPEAVYAISLYQSDYNASPVSRVTDNKISGLSHQIKVKWAGGNAGFTAKTYIQSEHPLPSGAIERIESGARSSELYVNGKKIK